MQNVYYVKINLCSAYVNEMSIKFLEKIFVTKSFKALSLHRFYLIEYNYTSQSALS